MSWSKYPELLDQVILESLRGERKAKTTAPWVDLYARLSKEIGPGAELLGGGLVMNVYTNLNPAALKRPGERPADAGPEVPHG